MTWFCPLEIDWIDCWHLLLLRSRVSDRLSQRTRHQRKEGGDFFGLKITRAHAFFYKIMCTDKSLIIKQAIFHLKIWIVNLDFFGDFNKPAFLNVWREVAHVLQALDVNLVMLWFWIAFCWISELQQFAKILNKILNPDMTLSVVLILSRYKSQLPSVAMLLKPA